MRWSTYSLLGIFCIAMLVGCSSIKTSLKEAWDGVPPEEAEKRELDALQRSYERSISSVSLINTSCVPITISGVFEKPIGYQDETDAQGMPVTKILKKKLPWKVDLAPGETYQIKLPAGEYTFNCDTRSRVYGVRCNSQIVDLPKMLLGSHQVAFTVSGAMQALGTKESHIVFENPWRDVTYVVRGHKLILGIREANNWRGEFVFDSAVS